MEKKIGQLYQKDSGEFYPKTHTGAVLTPDGRTAEQRNSDQMSDIEGKLSGKGSSASAAQYPMLFLGSFNSLGEANAKLNQVYNSTEWKYQGRLRLSVNSVTLWVEQYAINVTQGMWMQVAYGPFAPSADGSALVAEQGKAHVSFRMYNGHVNRAWTDFATNGLSLKTINGQSIIGSGDIHIEGGGSAVTIDPSIDETSEHAVQNKAIAKAIADLNAAIEGITQAEGGVVMVDFWAGTQPSTANDGDMFYNTSARKLFKMEHGDWVEQTLAEDCMYVAKPSGTLYRWEGDAMTSLYLALENRLRSLELNAVTQGDVDSMIAEELDGRGVLDASKMKTIGGVSVVKSGSDTNIPMKTINGNELIGSGDITVEGGSGGCPIEPALWSSNYQDKDDWEVGDYWFNTAESNLYRCTDPHGEFEHVNKPCMLLFQDATYTYPYPGTIFRVADENNVSGNVAVNSIEIAGKTVQLKTINGQGIVGSGDIVIEGDGKSTPDNSKNCIYPEAFGAFGDGIDFYDWPIVCFGGMVNNEITDSGNTTVFVPAPSERLWGDKVGVAVDSKGNLIYSPGNIGLSVTAADVIYSTLLGKFLLHYDGKYYSSWGNSDVWNNSVGTPRTDTVFSDISIRETPVSYNYPSFENNIRGRQGQRVSYVYKEEAGTDISGTMWNAQSFVDIDRLMHNDCNSFYSWLAKAEDGYELRLTKGKVYYVKVPKVTYNGSSWDDVHLPYVFGGKSSTKNYNGAIIDFEGAVIFLRLDDPGYPHHSYYDASKKAHKTDMYSTAETAVFLLYAAQNITFKNLTVRALRDRDAGCVGSVSRLSTSDSALKLFKFADTNDGYFADNVKIENLDVRNMNTDFDLNATERERIGRIEIDGWKSVGVCWNTIRGIDLVIRNADVTTARYIGGCGYHIFYFQNNMNSFLCCDSTFRHADHFNEIMVSYSDRMTRGNIPLVFKNCTFVGGNMFKPYPYIFEGCTIRQVNKYSAATMSFFPLDTSTGVFELSTYKTELHNTAVILASLNLGLNGKDCLVLDNVSVLVGDDFLDTRNLFVNYEGATLVKNFTTNHAATGINTYDYDAGQRALLSAEIGDTNKRIDDMRDLVSGDMEIIDGDPYNPSLDEEWYNTKAGEARKCTKEGEPATVGWNIRKLSAFAEAYTGESTVRIAPNESITFTYTDLTKDDFYDFLRKVLKGKGYTETTSSGINSGAGKFYLKVPSNNTHYLMIRTKTAGVKANSISFEGNLDSGYPFFSTKATSASGAIDGEAFEYTTNFTARGLLPKVEKLEQSSGLALVPDFVQTTAPQSATAGQTWFDTANGVIKRYNGNTWVGADGEGVTRVVYANSKLYLCVASNVVKEIALNDLPNS